MGDQANRSRVISWWFSSWMTGTKDKDSSHPVEVYMIAWHNCIGCTKVNHLSVMSYSEATLYSNPLVIYARCFHCMNLVTDMPVWLNLLHLAVYIVQQIITRINPEHSFPLSTNQTITPSHYQWWVRTVCCPSLLQTVPQSFASIPITLNHQLLAHGA